MQAVILKREILLAALLLLCAGTGLAQERPSQFSLQRSSTEQSDRPLSNSAVDLLVRGDTLWVAGGK